MKVNNVNPIIVNNVNPIKIINIIVCNNIFYTPIPSFIKLIYVNHLINAPPHPISFKQYRQ